MSKSLKWRWLDAVQSEAGPRSTVRHLCLCLATHMDNDGGRCFPGTRTIASEMGVQRSTVLEAIREARETGWLHVEERRGGRRGGSYFQYHPASPPVESGRGIGPVPGGEVVGDSDQYERGGSGRAGGGSGRIHPSKVVGDSDLSSSVVSQRSSHGKFPGVQNAGEEQPSTDDAVVGPQAVDSIRRLRVELGHLPESGEGEAA